MSNPFFFPANTSPISPVRSCEDLKSGHGSITSQTTSTAITSAELVHRINVQPLSRSLTDVTAHHRVVTQTWKGNAIIAMLLDSPASTPRLRPAHNGNDDLHCIPQDVATRQDSPTPLPPSDTSVSRSLDQPSPSTALTPSTTRTTSTGDWLNPADTTQGNPLSSQRSSFDGVDGDKSGALPTTVQLKRASYQRASSHGVLKHRTMSGWMDGAGGNEDGSTNAREPSLEARREAFSNENRNRSSSRTGKGRVEKRIEATLPKAEQTLNARSRKSSHILGLFKENTALQDLKSKPETSALSDGKSAGLETVNVSRGPHEKVNPSPVNNEAQHEPSGFPRVKNDDEQGKASSPEYECSFPHGRRKLSAGTGAFKPFEYTLGPNQIGSEGEAADAANIIEDPNHHGFGGSNDTMPTKLVEEIRNHHNLVPPFHDKFKSRHDDNQGATLRRPSKDSTSTKVELDLGAMDLDDDVALPKAIGTADKARVEEEDDSDKEEQISSALYYPHQAPSPDALEEVNIDTADQLGFPAVDAQAAQARLESPDGGYGDSLSEDVDITLQSQNKSRYLHGDLQKTWIPSGESVEPIAVESGASSASESEYDPSEDSSHTDELETTPTATPIVKDVLLSSRRRKPRRPRIAPLGAVELKPYNHQVGGHTKVFQFSKQAVCKQLSNRENEFYEVVEREHPELLKFLPRYE